MLILFILLSILSISFNVVLILYIKHLVKQYDDIFKQNDIALKPYYNLNDNVNYILKILSELHNHLDTIYNMNIYYKDPHLDEMAKHINFVIEEIKQYSIPEDLKANLREQIQNIDEEPKEE